MVNAEDCNESSVEARNRKFFVWAELLFERGAHTLPRIAQELAQGFTHGFGKTPVILAACAGEWLRSRFPHLADPSAALERTSAERGADFH